MRMTAGGISMEQSNHVAQVERPFFGRWQAVLHIRETRVMYIDA
jgi:hypothetical protein